MRLNLTEIGHSGPGCSSNQDVCLSVGLMSLLDVFFVLRGHFLVDCPLWSVEPKNKEFFRIGLVDWVKPPFQQAPVPTHPLMDPNRGPNLFTRLFHITHGPDLWSLKKSSCSVLDSWIGNEWEVFDPDSWTRSVNPTCSPDLFT